jgi:hypothetical protein
VDEPAGIVIEVMAPPPRDEAKIFDPAELEVRVTTVPPEGAAIAVPESFCSCTVFGPRLAESDADPETAGVRKASLVAVAVVTVTVTGALAVLRAVHDRNAAVTV